MELYLFLALPPVLVPFSLPFIHPYWIVGFIMGDGGFTFAKSVTQSSKTKDVKVYFSMQMFVAQLKMDVYLLRTIANYFGSGLVRFYDNTPIAQLVFSDKNTILHLILPFFNSYPLLGNKRIQYDLWLKAVLVNLGNPNYSKEKEQNLIVLLTALSVYQSRAQDKEHLAKYLKS